MKMSVVILDTDPLVEAMVLDCVGEEQAELEMVSEVHAARALIEGQDVTLIVINADMPKGWRFCAELRRNQATMAVPLLILSAKASDDVFHEHQKLPTRADAYLKKPIMVDQLRLAVLAVLKGESMDIDVDLGIDAIEVTEVNIDDQGAGSNTGPPLFVPLDAPAPEPPVVAQAPSGVLFAATEAEPSLSVPEVVPSPPPVVLSVPEVVSSPPPVVSPEVPPSPASPASASGLDVLSAATNPDPFVEQFVEASATIDSSVALNVVSQERDFLKTRVDELAQTGKALEYAQTDQAQQNELLRRQLEALQAERDLIEDSRQRLAAELERSLYKQKELNQALVDTSQAQSESTGADSQYVRMLEAHVDQLHGVFEAVTNQAAAGDVGLRTALARYQEREAALTGMRESENRLTDTLLAVLEHVYEGLDLLRQDIHNGVPEVPDLESLPEPPSGVPSPFVAPQLPLRPTRLDAPEPAAAPSAPTSEMDGVQLETLAMQQSLESEALPLVEEPSVTRDAPTPTMNLDDLDNLQALAGPTTPTEDPSLSVAGTSLLDPELMVELGVDPSVNPGGDVPFSSQDS
jgi:CheY-like chemotaxis protein